MEALKVAKYIITESMRMDKPVSNLKLQKLLYFVQGVTLIMTGKPAFDDSLEAWKYGPVVPSVYYNFSSYGSDPILMEYMSDVDLDSIRDHIDYVIDTFKDTSAISLVNETHRKGSPWYYAYNQGDGFISNDKIKDYFSTEYLRRDDA